MERIKDIIWDNFLYRVAFLGFMLGWVPFVLLTKAYEALTS